MRKNNALCGFLFISLLLSSYLAPGSVYASTPSDVLTLEDASVFLKIGAKKLETIAIQKQIPGQIIGNEWRFSKVALLDWLSGQPNSSAQIQGETDTTSIEKHQADSSPKQKDTESGTASLKGNGEQELQTIGQNPTGASSEDIFLRNETITLQKREFTVELGQFYSYSDNQSAFYSSKREAFTTNFGLRYGLFDNLQLNAFIPFMHHVDEVYSLNDTQETNASKWGAINTGIQRSMIQEQAWLPGVNVSVGGKIPISSEETYGYNLGMSLTKSFDPAVIYANIAYYHNFERNNDEEQIMSGDAIETQFEMKDYITATVGYALSLNDTLTIGTSIDALFPIQSKGGDPFQQNQKQFSIQLGLTSLITKKIYIDPSVSFGLNGAASDITMGFNLCYTFN